MLVGLPWTLILAPFLPVPARIHLGEVYHLTLATLGVVLIVGFLWDGIYYGLQQFRWDKDWPSSFALLSGVNEGVSTWLVVQTFSSSHAPIALPHLGFPSFAIHFSTTWLLLWLVMQGPLRLVALRWRFQGGRLY